MCTLNKIRCAIWGCGFLAVFFLGSYLWLITDYEVKRKKHQEDYLNTPIPSYVAEDLCSRGLVPKYISECTGVIFIRRRDILELFQSQLSQQTTYDEVTQLFGQYEQFCHIRDGGTFYCLYKLGSPPYISVEYDMSNQTVKAVN